MKQFTKKDLVFSVLSGFITGLIAWQVLEFLKTPHFLGTSFIWLMVIVPIVWIMGVWLGFFLGRWMSFFTQFGKFAAIGFTNFAVDIGILNALIASTGHALGGRYALFKGIAFLIAATHSFAWNKYWTFEAGSTGGGGGEFGKFMAVNLVAAGINVGVATLVANGIEPVLGLSPELWANVAAVVGSAAALIFSFVGIRLFVFKK
ncbi:MAG: GtrA family protein [bacterium]|nr:GtrA family protein [bacterium]